MMPTLILTFVVFLLAVLAMVVGVLVTGRSLKGSCGGPSCECAAEGRDVLECGKTESSASSLPMHPSS
jgi:hypothetical protein